MTYNPTRKRINPRVDGNIAAHHTDMTVSDFLAKFRRADLNVAGLLDYGYVPHQIAEMLKISEREVHNIMVKHNYVTIDKLPPATPKDTE